MSETHTEETTEEDAPPVIVFENQGSEGADLRKIGLYGPIDEESCSSVVYLLLSLAEKGKKVDETGVETVEPIELFLSTAGGAASDMFAVYDVMRHLKEKVPIETFGIGRVMSAGVLLLAAGTKGGRRIGKHCRVMLHSVASGYTGELYSLENELEEVQHTQNQYIKALAAETDMTEKYIKKILDKKINVYFTAEEAVELGIVDEVV